MNCFYNEIDPGKAEWLRQLMAHGVIQKGIVDERSIEVIKPEELEGYTRCGFFAGIGIWDYALQLAGWPDDAEAWHGSCPCQPFSVAGQRKGEADERHLWPAWFNLITQRRPITVFGEQVSDGDGQAWLDTVQLQMESVGYRFGSLTLPAASLGAPHGRHRTFFVADTHGSFGKQSEPRTMQRNTKEHGSTGVMANVQHRNGGIKLQPSGSTEHRGPGPSGDGENSSLEHSRLRGPDIAKGSGILVHDQQAGLEGFGRNGVERNQPGWNGTGPNGSTSKASATGIMGNTQEINGSLSIRQERREVVEHGRPIATNGFWADAEWVPCRGEIPGTIVWRPIKPESQPLDDGASTDLLRLCNYGFPLVKGAEARALRLKGYGDGICLQVAVEFIKAYLEIRNKEL